MKRRKTRRSRSLHTAGTNKEKRLLPPSTEN